MTVFISGKITDNPNYREEFAQAEKMINSYSGLVALNPTILPLGLNNRDYMQIGLQMINNSDAIFMLPNWTESSGARVEHSYAKYLDMLIFYSEEEMAPWAMNGVADGYTNEIESSLYDIEEIHDNCTVEIWKNSATGEFSIGWQENNSWIPLTEDNIPEECVIAYSPTQGQMIGWIFEDHDGTFYCESAGVCIENVTHWREKNKAPSK